MPAYTFAQSDEDEFSEPEGDEASTGEDLDEESPEESVDESEAGDEFDSPDNGIEASADVKDEPVISDEFETDGTESEITEASGDCPEDASAIRERIAEVAARRAELEGEQQPFALTRSESPARTRRWKALSVRPPRH